MTVFAALGDSITLGLGDPLPGGAWRGWASLLSDSLPEPELHNFALPGARSADVERDQLPRALELRPDVASVVMGINDTLRARFDPARIEQSAAHTVGSLRAAGAVVLTMRLPEPGQMLGLPGSLARPLARRMALLNAVMDGVAARFGTVHFDAAAQPQTYDRRSWSVDRLHPSERGHRLIACCFYDKLAAAGHPVGGRPGAEPSRPAPTRAAEFAWMATKGTGWLVRRSTDLVPYLLAMAVREWWAGSGPPSPEALSRPGPEAPLPVPGHEGKPR